MDKCEIKYLSKLRNGYPKYWCKTHFTQITVKKGEAAPLKCQNFSKPKISEDDKLVLDPSEWSGGVALWGSLDPVYNTSSEPSHQPGIHVHTRMNKTEKKEIDFTFKVVDVKSPEENLFGETFVTIDTEIAHAYTASMVFGKEMKVLNCPNCSKPHVDAGFFAVTYHKKHMCTYCGKEFHDSERSISNPIIELQKQFKSSLMQRTLKLADEILDVTQADYPGGIQIWGSNPAIIWTAQREEEHGIHVHLFKEKGSHKPYKDGTFGKVIIDGVELIATEVRCLMVQNSLSFLNGKLLSLYCTSCNSPHTDRGDQGIRPHEHHLCEFCGEEFVSQIKCVSNPILDKLKRLNELYGFLQK